MSQPDFTCSIEDNHGVLIVIHIIQQNHVISALPEWPTVLAAVTRFCQLSFENTPREVNFRYQIRHAITRQDNSLQQIHRRVFGVICIALLEHDVDYEAEKRHILREYNEYLAHYGPTVLESRCLVIRDNATDAAAPQSDKSDDSLVGRHRDGRNGEIPFNQPTTASLSKLGAGLIRQSLATSNGGLGHDLLLLRPVHKSLSEANLSAVASAPEKSQKTYIEIRLRRMLREQMSQIMEDYLLALFSSIEAKRPMSVPDKPDKDWKGSNPSLDKIEPVKKDGFKFDIGSTQKKKRLGGMRKVFAEWLLIAGLPYAACQFFGQAVDLLQSAKEILQLATALEGWAAASYYVLPAADPTLALKLASLDDPDRRIILTRTKAASLNGYLVNGFNLHVPDHAKDRKHCLTSDVIYDKLRLAADTYSIAEKGELELEASLKLARLFIFLGDRILAHKGLRQATFVKIDVQTNDSRERIDRFLTIAELYEEIGFYRQASLFRLLAADRCIGPGSTPSSCTDAFRLTVKSLGAYSLNLSTKPTVSHGWPELQAQVMIKLAATCRSDPKIYGRILLIILETFIDVLSLTEKEELVKCLTDIIAQHGPPTGDVSVIETGSLGVTSLTKIPFVHEFTVMPLPHHLQPLVRPKLKRGLSGPFLYTPIKSSGQLAVRDPDEADFLWVAGEPCSFTLCLSNRLPRELRVENLTIDTADVPFDAAKASLVLPPIIGPVFPVVIAGIPFEPGLLTVLGYSFSLFGLQNRCPVAELTQFERNTPPRIVKVAPSLPQIRVETSWPPCDMFVDVGEPVVATASLVMYSGQRLACVIKLHNIGKEPIESLSIVVSSTDSILVERCVSYDYTTLDAALPVQPGDSTEIQLNIWAAVSFSSTPSMTEPTNAVTELLQFIVRIDYSGGPGMLQHYYRLSSVAFFVDVVPSVAITQWDILAAEDPEQFYLVVDFENRTDEEIEVLYPPEKKMLIVGRDRARIPALADKIPLLFDDSSLATQNECRLHMSDKVDLSWRFVEKSITGRCWIGDLTWNNVQMEAMSLPPVLVEFSANGTLLEDSGITRIFVNAGIPVDLQIGLRNRFSKAISCLGIRVVIREENIPTDEIADSKIALLAGISQTVLDFEEKGQHAFNCQVIMLIPGIFHLDVAFELAGHHWTVVDTCLFTVALTAGETSPNSTDL